MFPNRYDIDDMSREAKEERNTKSQILKYVIITGFLVLLSQPIYLTYIYWGNIPSNMCILLSCLMTLWGWCIYKVFNVEFRHKKDID